LVEQVSVTSANINDGKAGPDASLRLLWDLMAYVAQLMRRSSLP